MSSIFEYLFTFKVNIANFLPPNPKEYLELQKETFLLGYNKLPPVNHAPQLLIKDAQGNLHLKSALIEHPLNLEPFDEITELLPLMLDEIISIIIIIVGGLIVIAFITVFERKIMGIYQERKGPNYVGLWGSLQAVADGVKLVGKETERPATINLNLYYNAPVVTFMVSFLGWLVIPITGVEPLYDTTMPIIYTFAISTVGVYGIIMSGWSSHSKYAFLGSLRSAAQMISYEVCIGILIVIVALFSTSLEYVYITLVQKNCWFFVPLAPVVKMFFICVLAETNRPPFDLPEAEAELVSGYSTEYAALLFALFFIGEYGNIFFMCTLMTTLFFGGDLPGVVFGFNLSGLIFSLKVSFLVFLIIWSRVNLPRYRYDLLMNLCWKLFLPMTLGLILIYGAVVIYYLNNVADLSPIVIPPVNYKF